MNKEIKKSLKEIKEGKATIILSLINYWELLRRAKKEVFDDIENFYATDRCIINQCKHYKELKVKHLNTSNTDEVKK